jgi:aminoglycoside phosphotransferase (APT) family kinase protein
VADARAETEAKLAEWLRARGEDAPVEIAERTTVGLSQETWLGRVGGEDVVLRLPTPSSGHRAILSQRQALAAVGGDDGPWPRLLFHDDTADNPFERPFIVMRRIHGKVPVGWHDLPEDERLAVARESMDVLAALHAIDVGATPLAGNDPSPLMTFPGLVKLFERVAPLPPVLEAGLWWLGRHGPPEPQRWTIVHGDFRMGNMIVADGRLAGVLDWEMAAPGDPIVDVVWNFISLWDLAPIDEEPLIERYARAAGVELDSEHLRWHRALGYARLSYYMLSGLRAFDRERSDDLRLAAFRLQLPVLLERMTAVIAGEPVR